MQILISTWGSPWKDPLGNLTDENNIKWKKVEYRLPFNSQKIHYARTTVIPLSEELNPDFTLILGTDTISVPPQGKAYAPPQGKAYADLVKDAKGKYMEFLKYACDEAKQQLPSNVDVAIIPFPGRFPLKGPSGQTTLNSDVGAFDVRRFLLWEMSKAIYQHIEKRDEAAMTNEKVTIYVDTSHGFNVMPVLAYSIAKELADVLALTYDVQVQELNSMPVNENASPSTGEVDILNVDSYKGKLFSGLNVNKPDALTNGGKIRGLKRRAQVSEEDFLCEVRKGDVAAFIVGVAYALPLVIYKYFPNHEDLLKCGEAIVDKWMENSNYTLGDSEATITHSYALNDDFEAVAVSILMSLLLSRIGVERKTCLTLDEIKKLSEKVYYKSHIWSYLISNTVRELDLMQKGEQSITTRNFIAHSGVNDGLVAYNYDNERITVSYRENTDQIVLRRIEDLLSSKSEPRNPSGSNEPGQAPSQP